MASAAAFLPTPPVSFPWTLGGGNYPAARTIWKSQRWKEPWDVNVLAGASEQVGTLEPQHAADSGGLPQCSWLFFFNLHHQEKWVKHSSIWPDDYSRSDSYAPSTTWKLVQGEGCEPCVRRALCTRGIHRLFTKETSQTHQTIFKELNPLKLI